MGGDRFKDLSPGEARIATARRDGKDVVDRYGRVRVPLGNGPMSDLIRAIHPIQSRRRPLNSTVLTANDFMRSYEAVAVANARRKVLNTFLTVTWNAGGDVNQSYAEELHSRFLASMRTWFDDRERVGDLPAESYMAIWVKEVGQRLGMHSHFLLHLPQNRFHDFRYWAASAVRHLLELPRPDPRAPVAPVRATHLSRLGEDVSQQWNVFRYMMKGMDPDALSLIAPDHRLKLICEFANLTPRDQGRIVGRRCGRSHSLGPAARRKIEREYGLLELWDGDLQIEALPYDDRYLHHGELRQILGALKP